MRNVGPDGTFIDYFQNTSPTHRGLINHFGIRVREGRWAAVVKIGDGQPFVFGKEYPLPVELEALPNHLRVMIDDYVLHYPDSELAGVLAGKTSFQTALDSPTEAVVVGSEKVRSAKS